jgi:hypothetical protein
MEYSDYIGKYCKYPDRAWMVYIIVDYYDTCKSCSLNLEFTQNEDGDMVKTCDNCKLFHPDIHFCPNTLYDVNAENCFNCYKKTKKFVTIKNSHKTYENISIDLIKIIDDYVLPKNKYNIDDKIDITKIINGLKFKYTYKVKSYEIFYDTITYELEDISTKKIIEMTELDISLYLTDQSFKLYDDVYVEFNINNDYYYKYGYIDKILNDNKFVIKFRKCEDIAFVSKSRLKKIL